MKYREHVCTDACKHPPIPDPADDPGMETMGHDHPFLFVMGIAALPLAVIIYLAWIQVNP